MSTQFHTTFYLPDGYISLQRSASDPTDAILYHTEREVSFLSKRSGEGRLMFEILDSAIHDVVRGCLSNKRRTTRIKKEALDWINSDESQWIYSFLSICETLDLDPERIRKRLEIAEDIIHLMWKHSVLTTKDPHLILLQVAKLIEEEKRSKRLSGSKVTQ